jgi:ribonuclease VapC
VIVVDTSALLTVVLREPGADRYADVLTDYEPLIISAATYVEAGIVAARRRLSSDLDDILHAVKLDIVPVDAERAERAIRAYRRFGKGFHPAKLNFGDCFAYELARSRDCPLLYVGEDFARTDVRGAITAAP